MKLLLLDHDGPMVTAQVRTHTNNKWDRPRFDVKCVAVLNFILQETGAEIICISDWRHNFTLSEMREMYAEFGVIRGPIGYTPSFTSYNGMNLEGGRADEIEAWIKTHAWKKDTKWCAVDDMNMDERLFPNFVHCPSDYEGIKQTGIKEKIIKILS